MKIIPQDCLLDYEYIKNRYRLIAVNLSLQEELNANLKAIQQIEFFGQLKKADNVNTIGAQSMFILLISEKNQRSKTKILPRKCNSLIKDSEF